MNIEELPGLEEEQVSRLHGAGMRTCRQLLRASRRQKGFVNLTKVAELRPEDLEQIVNVAELWEIRGVGRTSLNRLLEAGLGSPRELAAEEPEGLQRKLRRASAQPPNLAVLEHWILQARRREGGHGQALQNRSDRHGSKGTLAPRTLPPDGKT